MADSNSLLIPKEQLANMRRWAPGTLAPAAAPPTRARTAPAATAQAAPAPASPQPAFEAAAILAARAALEAERRRLGEERSAAYESGRKAGFEAGYAEGRALVEAHLARLQSLGATVQTAVAQFEQSVADQLIALALDIARRVIRTEIATSRDQLLPLVQEALRAIPEDTKGGELTLHPDDFELIRDRLDEELRLGVWTVVPDPSIDPGGCRITTRNCDIDATLVSRWRTVMQSLGRTDGWIRGSDAA